MYEKINGEISKVKERFRKREKVEKLIKGAEGHLKEETSRREKLNNILTREERDVKVLEGLSIKGIFFTVLGSKEEKMDKEKAEFLAAKLKYDECCNSINFVKQEIDEYYRQRRELGNTQYEYEELIKKKEKLVMEAKDANTRKILDLMEEMADIKADMKEIREAIDAGDSVLYSLESAASSLNSAENWGTFDMLGGGLISDIAKHSHIDESVRFIEEASRKLSTFKRELSDVELNIDVRMNIGSFDKFADYFFDGLLADWNVQSKIKDSASSISEAIYRVQSTVDNLKAQYDSKESSLEGIEAEIKSIIENA